MTDVRTGEQWQRKRVFIRTYGCQMNVYDSDRMADVLRPLGYALPTTPEQADLVVLNTCHIREKALGEGLFRARPPARRKLERRAEGRDLTIAVAGCVAQAEGEEIVRRAAGRRHRRRAAGLSPPARAAGRGRAQGRDPRAGKRLPGAGVLDTDFPAESKFDHLPAPRRRARRLGVPVDPGRLRQVLHLLRRALHARRRIFAAGRGGAGRGARSWSAAGAIEITLLGQNVNAYHGEARSDGVDLVAGAADPRAGRDRWRGAHPLHDLASARHGRRADRRAWRGAAAHAVPASAGAVGLRPHPRGDEPPARPRSLTCAWSIACARVGPISRCRPTSSSASRARATPISTTRCGWSTRSASPRPSPSSTAAGPARPARRCADQVPETRQGGAARRPAGAARPAGARLQRLQGRRHRAGAVRRDRAASPARSSARRPWLQSVYAEGESAPDRPHRRRCA